MVRPCTVPLSLQARIAAWSLCLGAALAAFADCCRCWGGVRPFGPACAVPSQAGLGRDTGTAYLPDGSPTGKGTYPWSPLHVLFGLSRFFASSSFALLVALAPRWSVTFVRFRAPRLVAPCPGVGECPRTGTLGQKQHETAIVDALVQGRPCEVCSALRAGVSRSALR